MRNVLLIVLTQNECMADVVVAPMLTTRGGLGKIISYKALLTERDVDVDVDVYVLAHHIHCVVTIFILL